MCGAARVPCQSPASTPSSASGWKYHVLGAKNRRVKGLCPEQGGQEKGCKAVKVSSCCPVSVLPLDQDEEKGTEHDDRHGAGSSSSPQHSSQKHQHNPHSSQDWNANTYFVEGSAASQDYMGVLNLDGPLTQPNKVSPNSNCPTCNLKKKRKEENHIDLCFTTQPKPIDSNN